MLGNLYVITNNINNMQYVGKTYNCVQKRWKDHIKKSRTDINRPLYRAIAKYGQENFSIEIVGQFEENILEDKEIELISELDTFKNGYNATLGGDGRRYLTISDEDIIKSYAITGNILLTSIELKTSEGTVTKVLKANNVEIRGKEAHQKAMTIACGKRILCVDSNEIYNSMSDCARDLIKAGLSSSSVKTVASNISRVTLNQRKTYLGMTFRCVN